MNYYNSSVLDRIAERVETVTVSVNQQVREYTGEQAAQKIAGIIARKYFNGEKISLTVNYDYTLGCKRIDMVNYGNGYVERFEYKLAGE